MQLEIIILIPKLDASGPARGAVALYNGLQNLGVPSRLVPMKEDTFEHEITPDKLLSECRYFFQQIYKLKQEVRTCEKINKKIRIISFCLQADFLLCLSGLRSKSISSVRGDLYKNYTDDMGVRGYFWAWLHYKILSKFFLVTALNKQMLCDIEKYAQRVKLIPNFIDEKTQVNPEKAPMGHFKFVFLGKLSRRKAILETIDAFASIVVTHPSAELHIVGDGPLMSAVKALVENHRIKENVVIYGFKENPLSILRSCDALVLPSYSEGISRAAMEALFSGKRCIMQNVDGNAELIQSLKQGILIEDISQLEKAMRQLISDGREKDEMRLPVQFRQNICAASYLIELEKS